VFRALAYEVSTKGGKGVEPAMRVTYDDANECFVLPQNVARIIKDVGWCAAHAWCLRTDACTLTACNLLCFTPYGSQVLAAIAAFASGEEEQRPQRLHGPHSQV
jgi:hypothetical protein